MRAFTSAKRESRRWASVVVESWRAEHALLATPNQRLATLAEAASMRLGIYVMLARGAMAGEAVVGSAGIAREHAVSALAELFQHVATRGAPDAFRAVAQSVQRRVMAFQEGCLDVAHVETMGEALLGAARALSK